MKRILSVLLICIMLWGCAEPVGCSHTDKDRDDTCDRCGISVAVKLVLGGINDLHGKFLDSDTQPGVDELSVYLEQENMILLASGDLWQGSSESNLTQGALITRWMNEMGFSAMALGNHEFDWGLEAIRENAQLANFPFLAINVYDRSTHAPVDFCQPSVLVERQGVRVGIIGAIGDCYFSIAPEKVTEIYFQTGSALTQLVKAEALRLRQQGADVVVYLLHDGYEENNATDLTAGQMADYYDVSLSDGYVDLVFEGHSHKRYAYTDSFGVWHLQGGGENRGISRAQLTYNWVNKEISQVKGEWISSGEYEKYPSHSIIGTLLQEFEEEIAPGNQVLGDNRRWRDSEELRELVVKLYYEAGQKAWGSDYSICLAGAFLQTRNPYDLEEGSVSYGMLQALFPFDNELVLCSIRGSDLVHRFLETDNERYFIFPEWVENIDPNGTYYIVTDTYTSTYAPNRLTEVQRYASGVYARDLLAEYIKLGGLAA